MEIIYRCCDGKEFNDEDKAYQYEWDITHKDLKYIVAKDSDDNVIIGNLMEEDIYLKIDSLYIPSNEAAEQLREIGEITGYVDYQKVNSPGLWEFITDENGLQSLVKKDV